MVPLPTVGNLPLDLTSFVGRRRELADARALLARSRLLTLTGVGGVGKTRLALQLAGSVRRAFPDGVWWVDLTRLSGPRLLARAVAEAVEIREHSRRDPLVVLCEHFADRRALLVLDNCETMSHECGSVADALLKQAPELRVLATSRERLNISAEVLMVVPPLSLSAEPGGSGQEHSEGLELFVRRARSVQADFRTDNHNCAVVEDICRRLDGLPLAIELAAARVRALSPEQILARLDDPYRLLSSGPAGSEPRHRTLRALIDWSFQLCTEPEQLLWMRSSVFAGNFDLEAAESVCRGEGIPPGSVVDLVAGLIDKSILHREQHGSVSRYRQIETIRQFGRERLADSGEEQFVRLRHRQHYQRIATRTWSAQFGPHQVDWFARLRLDHADLRVALENCASDPGAASDGLRMAADLLYHWISSFYLNEGRGWLDDFLTLAPAPSTDRADALWVNGWLALIQSDLSAAESMLAEARALATRLGAAKALAYTALFSGMAASFRQDSETALQLYREALDGHRTADNPHGIASTLIRSAMAYSHLGDSERAIALAEECLAVCDAAGDVWHKAYALTALGIEVWRQGDTRRAEVLERESLGLNHELDDRLGIVLNLEILALIAETDGRGEHAARLFGVLRSLSRSLGVSLRAYTHLADHYDECVRRLRNALGERDYQALLDEGASLTLEDALHLAAEEDLRPDVRSAADDAPRLTRREREVAELVAQGMSNKEIAAKLMIASRTAESHIEHILVKLGFTTRTQIATWVADHSRPVAE
ncbi:LuxR family transcriptional regulator [Saccharopolyspora spinosporotrichia]|uniref:LuxR family transcriptional regulator n=1 Tax=Saccharopolyspora erythraea TaxID=1836 RepID=A0ABP3MSM6_SACER|nr:LuxR family transcriptional regulator [Saccharopolyspora erythraea D]